MKCENPNCERDVKMDVTMPLPIGMFRAKMCMECGLQIHDNMEVIDNILRKRALERGIKLPTDITQLNKLCEESEKNDKVC